MNLVTRKRKEKEKKVLQWLSENIQLYTTLSLLIELQTRY